MTSPLTPLSYAPPHPRWRRHVRRGVLCLLLISVIAPLLYWRTPLWYHLCLYHAQRQCLRYRAPADQVVYDEQPARAAGLINSGCGYVAHQRSSFTQAAPSVPPIAAYIPPCWQQLQSLALGPPTTDALLFMHERRSASGQRRLVVIIAQRDALHPFGRFKTFSLRPTIVDGPQTMVSVVADGAATATRAAELGLIGLYRYSLFDDLLDGARSSGIANARADLRFFAGQPDPNDASHFTVPFELEGRRDVMEGWLEDDGSITFQIGDHCENDIGWPRIGRRHPPQ